MLHFPELWDEGICFDTMIVQDFLLSCFNMLLDGHNVNLDFSSGMIWMIWVPGLHYFFECDRQACINADPPKQQFRRAFPQNRRTPAVISLRPHESKNTSDEDMLWCDV